MLTGQEVWQAIQNDPQMRGQEYLHEVLRPYVEAVPDILGDDLQKLVSVETLVRGRLKFVQYCLENGLVEKAIAATPEDALGWFSRDDMVGIMRTTLSGVVSLAESVLSDIPAFFEEMGATETEIILSESTGLNDAMRARYQQGDLTMEELMREQPGQVVFD